MPAQGFHTFKCSMPQIENVEQTICPLHGFRNRLRWEDVLSYLEITIGMESDLDLERVNALFNLAEHICPEELRLLFVSNYLDTAGKAQYKDLWFFSDSYVMEVLNFAKIETPVAEMTILNQNLQYISIESKDYSFKEKVKITSTLHIQTVTLGRFECDFLATGRNCQTLHHIFDKYLQCNLVRGQSSGIF